MTEFAYSCVDAMACSCVGAHVRSIGMMHVITADTCSMYKVFDCFFDHSASFMMDLFLQPFYNKMTPLGDSMLQIV
jgi:hypothetical protein